ncbi:MAG TPA: glycosyltransferase family 87 protein [Polyangiaceae bacterium]|jgi:hypothetical protein
MFFDDHQYTASLITVLVAAAIAAALVFWPAGTRRKVRRWGSVLLFACAVVALFSWSRFGARHTVWVDAPGVDGSDPHRQKVEQHVNFHYSEFFHYYLGAKYFRELGYEGLYDCTALADNEVAAEDHVRPRIGGWVRDLDDILRDKTYTDALAHCRNEVKPRFSPERWASFLGDVRELRRLADDGIWPGLVYDAGFNPPPSWSVVGSAAANAIPIRFHGRPTFLLATGLDVALLIVCFLGLRKAFGSGVAAMAALFFGASFIASYGWNGGAFLRYTWLTTVVLGLCAVRRGRWALAGALFAASTCDRVFPAGFAVGALVPVAWGALRSVEDRHKLKRFAAGFGATVGVLVVASLLWFGTESWRVFFMRIGRHGDVYFVMHIGLKKVLTWRSWVANKNFHGHTGLQAFRDWNLQLRATWASMRPTAIPIQLAAVGGALYAGIRRRPYESALLLGIVGMFFFNLPANYYYVVLALVPALLFHAAMTAPSRSRRYGDLGVFVAFVAFWVTTFVAPKHWNDGIVYDYVICLALTIFLGGWILAWADYSWRRQHQATRGAVLPVPAGAGSAGVESGPAQ